MMKQKRATSLLETKIHQIILDSKSGKYGSGHAAALIMREIESETKKERETNSLTLLTVSGIMEVEVEYIS